MMLGFSTGWYVWLELPFVLLFSPASNHGCACQIMRKGRGGA